MAEQLPDQVSTTRAQAPEEGLDKPIIDRLAAALTEGARDEDVRTFVQAVGFDWLVAGTDAHAKNYALLISGAPRVRLAPLYDVACQKALCAAEDR